MNEVVTSLAESSGRPLIEVERLWRECKREARLRGHSKDYAFATSLLKHRLGLDECVKTLKRGDKVRYRGMSGSVLHTTPDTALVKLKANDTDLGRIIAASNGLIAVPILSLEETTSSMAVGSMPISTMRPLTMGAGKKASRPGLHSYASGSKVAMRSGKKAYVQAPGPDYSVIAMLDVHGNPTGETRRVKNSMLRRLSEAEMRTDFQEAVRKITLGEISAANYVDRLLDESTDSETRAVPRRPVAVGRFHKPLHEEEQLIQADDEKPEVGEGQLDASDMALIKAGTESDGTPVGTEEPIPAAAAIVAPDATPGGEEPVPEEELPPALTGEGEEPAAELETEGEDDFGDRAVALEDDDEKPKKPEAKEPEKAEESVKPTTAPYRPTAKTAASAADYLKQRLGQSGIPSTPAPAQPQHSALDVILEARREKAEARHAEAEKRASGAPGGKGTVSTPHGDMSERKLNRATAMLQTIRGVPGA